MTGNEKITSYLDLRLTDLIEPSVIGSILYEALLITATMDASSLVVKAKINLIPVSFKEIPCILIISISLL